MSAVVGIVAISEQGEIGNLLKQMLGTMVHRGPDGAGVVIGGMAERKKTLEELGIEGKKGYTALGQVKLATLDGEADFQPVQSKDGRLALLFNGELYHCPRKARGVDTDKEKRDCEVVLRLVEEHYRGDLAAAVSQALPRLDGVYTLAVTDNRETVITRDKIGLRQLYFCNNGDHVAFASEKKPLMTISSPVIEIQRLLPGHIAVINREGVQESQFWNADSLRASTRINDKEEALRLYGEIIRASVRKRVAGKKGIGIVFSGGIDSLLLTCLVQEMDVPFTCYTAGREGAQDIEWAQSVAARFGFPLQTKTITLDELEMLVPEIIKTIEDHSLNQVEAAIALYVAARMAQENRERIIMTGQGPDEIFGGYPWYSTIVEREGYESFESYSWADTLVGYKETFERENKIAMTLGLEMSVPYIDPDVIKVAFRIPPELKIGRGNDRIQKRIHREFAVSIGVPGEIAFRPKEAAQHGANIHTGLEELARRTGVTESMLADAGYDPDRSVIEKLGSSSRYGFQYGDHHLWKPTAHMQYYLDSCALDVDLLPPESRSHWDATTNSLEAAGVITRRNER